MKIMVIRLDTVPYNTRVFSFFLIIEHAVSADGKKPQRNECIAPGFPLQQQRAHPDGIFNNLNATEPRGKKMSSLMNDDHEIEKE